MADKIQNAYESSKNIYDDVLTQGNFFSRLYIKLFWSGTDDNVIARKVLSYIPDDFSGELLDVPVGTAVFTERKWKSLNHAHITCLDYSTDMLAQAQERLDGCAHIRCMQGDVGNLPMFKVDCECSEYCAMRTPAGACLFAEAAEAQKQSAAALTSIANAMQNQRNNVTSA